MLFSVALNHWEGAPSKRLVFPCPFNAHFDKLSKNHRKKKNAFLSEGHTEIWWGCDRKLVKCTALIITQERLNKADLLFFKTSHLASGDSDAKSVDSYVSSFSRLVHLKHERTCEDSVLWIIITRMWKVCRVSKRFIFTDNNRGIAVIKSWEVIEIGFGIDGLAERGKTRVIEEKPFTVWTRTNNKLNQ